MDTALVSMLFSSTSLFGSILPSVPDVRKASPNDPEMARDLHTSQAMATGIVVAIGVVASIASKSPVPAMVAIVAAVVLCAVYEGIFQNHPTEKATV